MQEEHREDGQLIERGVMDILGESFSIYRRRFVKFVILVACVQVPISILELALALIAPDSAGATLFLGVVSATTSLLVYGAVIVAVGQHYVLDYISVERCYIRVMWRVVSVATFAVAVGVLFAALLYMANIAVVNEASMTPEDPETIDPQVAMSMMIAAVVMLVSLVALIIFGIYMVAVMPAIIVEGHRARGALSRAAQLLSGSKWRVLGHVIVYSLTVLGLWFVLSIPLIFMGLASGADTQSFARTAVGVVMNGAVSILITPITLIATTLLYYDLRVRKEEYDLNRLSQEMGIAAP